MFDWLGNPTAWVGLLTLTILEIVLGIDNIVFISILTGKLPKDQQEKGMKTGLILAVIPRVLLLLGIGWVMSLNTPLFNLPIAEPDPEMAKKFGANIGITGQDLVFLLGGLFLLFKSVKEIHHKLEGPEQHGPSGGAGKVGAAFGAIMVQLMLVNVVFSLDSVITAVGMIDAEKIGSQQGAVTIMIMAVLLSTLAMLVFAGPVSRFVETHPTVKMMALAFLILIGANLLGEGFHQHIPKGYTYFAMGFAVAIEMLNIRMAKGKPVKLNEATLPETAAG